MDRADVLAWVAADERAWREDDVAVGDLFTDDAVDVTPPSEDPLTGLAAIRGSWSDPRPFTTDAEVVARSRARTRWRGPRCATAATTRGSTGTCG